MNRSSTRLWAFFHLSVVVFAAGVTYASYSDWIEIDRLPYSVIKSGMIAFVTSIYAFPLLGLVRYARFRTWSSVLAVLAHMALAVFQIWMLLPCIT
ncbi:MAG: hypothetical protein PHR35_03905 [Kiritimatiellae bacterium]|nr:hypothetical protein [Kiritimatiellia bacterium]